LKRCREVLRWKKKRRQRKRGGEIEKEKFIRWVQKDSLARKKRKAFEKSIQKTKRPANGPQQKERK